MIFCENVVYITIIFSFFSYCYLFNNFTMALVPTHFDSQIKFRFSGSL